jgi:putative transposase
MKNSRFTEEQVIHPLRQAEGGTAIEDVCRSLGISRSTFNIWKKKYVELCVSEVGRLRQLEDENARLKRLVADPTLNKNILQEVIKKDPDPVRRHELAVRIRQTYNLAIDKTCD